MKSLKIVLASMMLTVGAISVLSFTANTYDSKAFATVCYKFTEDVAQDKVQKGDADQIQTGSFNLASNWEILSGVSTPSGAVCPPTDYLCAICFDNSVYSLSQALAIAWNTYNSLPTGATINHGDDVDPSSNVIRLYKRTFNAQ